MAVPKNKGAYIAWRKVDIWPCQNNLCCWRSSGSELVSSTILRLDLEQDLDQVYMQSASTRKYS